MTIEIKSREVEDLIQRRMLAGAFTSYEDLIRAALQTQPDGSRSDRSASGLSIS